MTSAQANDDVGSIVEPTSSLAWADVILADFQSVISRYLRNISIYFFYTAEIILKTIIMKNSRLIQACFPIKIDEVWIDRFCVRYDWWRRLQPTSSVSPVCNCYSMLGLKLIHVNKGDDYRHPYQSITITTTAFHWRCHPGYRALHYVHECIYLLCYQYVICNNIRLCAPYFTENTKLSLDSFLDKICFMW